jgi:hypothetical protein
MKLKGNILDSVPSPFSGRAGERLFSFPLPSERVRVRPFFFLTKIQHPPSFCNSQNHFGKEKGTNWCTLGKKRGLWEKKGDKKFELQIFLTVEPSVFRRNTEPSESSVPSALQLLTLNY